MDRERPSRVMPARRRILVVDSHPLVRRGLHALIDNEPDLSVCAEAATQREGFEKVAAAEPDLVIIDLWLGSGDGLALLRDIRSRNGDLPILVLTLHDAPVHAERALRAGASGYVTKREEDETLLRAIRCVLGGERYVSRGIEAALDDT